MDVRTEMLVFSRISSALTEGFGAGISARMTRGMSAGCPAPKLTLRAAFSFLNKLGDKFGESLGGGQATPSFWEVPGLPRKFPKLPRKFFGDFPGSSLTVELYSNPGVSGEVSQTSPEVSPFSGKPDTLS